MLQKFSNTYDKQIKKLLLKLLLTYCSDVESNPGPKKQYQISYCHWNLNGLAAHSFRFLITSYICIKKL